MCVIVDANAAPDVFRKPAKPSFEPLIKWFLSQNTGKKMVIGGKNRLELFKIAEARRSILRMERQGKIHFCPDRDVNEEEKKVSDVCISDDPHVIALARISKARTLCTSDVNLEKNFKNTRLVPSPKGGIYKNKNHEHLLRHTKGCPGYEKKGKGQT